eukprot:CAMPEP_0116875652 /NCGR_PEP_ID=MMETSP0463-20121206/7697_1 /TAXON_ID=181622 /ORGANISM="Strombidinopsis sp, Strain SopsisLIS2011" /LENGTH=91 /DNA_ID=CAMNT_0004521677 /DNA_START=523 /DNA_END=795 /DNA_ORIENTATION=+
MIFDVPYLISDLSKYMTLREGDVIMTGTPAGVGPVKHGDFVQATLYQDDQDLSKYMTLREGDVIMTGTPAGVGPVKHGDFVQAVPYLISDL